MRRRQCALSGRGVMANNAAGAFTLRFLIRLIRWWSPNSPMANATLGNVAQAIATRACHVSALQPPARHSPACLEYARVLAIFVFFLLANSQSADRCRLIDG